MTDVPSMTEKEYVPGGCTAFLDAVEDAIRDIIHIHKYACPKGVPAKMVFDILQTAWKTPVGATCWMK